MQGASVAQIAVRETIVPTNAPGKRGSMVKEIWESLHVSAFLEDVQCIYG